MHPVALLTTKLHVPPLRAQLVERPRLVERLEEGLRLGHKLALMSAPAGFGKTTLVSEWQHSRRGMTPAVPFTWLSLDERDNDPARFLAYLLAALQKIDPSIGDGGRRVRSTLGGELRAFAGRHADLPARG